MLNIIVCTIFLLLVSAKYCEPSTNLNSTSDYENPEHGSFARSSYHGMQILLVYHGFGSKNSNPLYEKLFYEQLMSVKNSGLFRIAQEFHITISSGAEYDKVLLQKSYQVIKRIDEKIVNITLQNDSYFEYMGIHKVWELHHTCIDKSKCLILYFHSTGSFNNFDGKNVRTPNNILLTRLIVEDWKYIINVFKHNEDAANLGLSAACFENPFQYYNFWWVRASYVATLPEPTPVTNRHYYENWIGQSKAIKKSSQLISLCETKYDVEPYKTAETCDARMMTAVRCKELLEDQMLHGKTRVKKSPRDANNSIIMP